MQRPIRILLFEDDPADQGLIRQELDSSGLKLELRAVKTKKAFLEELSSFDPDLVLSDYMVGTISGAVLMTEARKKRPYLPFIFVSWQIHEGSVIDVLRSGATDYVFLEQISRLTLSIHRALRELEEHRALEKATLDVRRSEEYFRSLIENSSDLILVLDKDLRVRYASPSVEKILGYANADFVGKDLMTFLHAEDQENARFVLSQEEGKPEFTLEFRFRHQSGIWRGLEAIGKSVKGEEGLLVIINARDITDRILEQEALRESIIRHLKTQTELQKTQAKIIQQERMAAIGQMASGIAHDFSNALMPVLGFSEILLSRPENLQDLEKVRKYIEMINTSARDAMHIVGSLREFYRQKEKSEHLLPMQVNKAIEQAVMLTQPKWREEARARGVNIQMKLHLGQVPEIVGNETAIREALTNLIFNAVDAMPANGDVAFTTRVDADHVVVEMADTGQGMDEETRQKCFEPFFSTKGKGGTGLGLSMVYGMMRRHEGTIDVKSQVGKGTTFILRFPVKRQSAASAPNKTSGPVIPAKLDRALRVLVVDDEPMVREVLTEYLSGDGHKVETATDGVQALKVYQANKFDLVITDRAMPEMGGDQLTAEIKKITPGVPLIMLTGFGELMKAKNEVPPGVDHLLSKPLTFEAYREALQKTAASGPVS